MGIFFGILLLITGKAFAYPNFIGFGYSSCMACHYNPYGNGPLTDYGRVVSATSISDRLIHSKNKSEEKIAANSAFLYTRAFNRWFRPSVDYRGMHMVKNLDKGKKEHKSIHMQADISAAIVPSESGKYFFSATFGYVPTPSAHKNKDVGNYRSREHYVGIRPRPQYGIYVGMMDKVFGIKISDHTAFSRSHTGLAQNDQSHGVLFHYLGEKWELGVHPFVGNLSQEVELRQKGVSTKMEYSLMNKLRLGTSFLQSKSEYAKNSLQALHVKWSFLYGSGLLFELGKKDKQIILTKKTTRSRYGLLRNYVRLRRGLFGILGADYLRPDISLDKRKILRLNFGLQFFPFQGVELRLDAYNSIAYSPLSQRQKSWSLVSQLHLWP